MDKHTVQCAIVYAYALILILIIRIVIPLVTEVDSKVLLKDLKFSAARVFIVITSQLLILINISCVGYMVFFFGSDLLFAFYLPILFLAIFVTYEILIVHMIPKIGSETISDYVLNAWNKHFTVQDTLLSSLQKELECCGMSGPSDYLHYLEELHLSCYLNNTKSSFYTLGCTEALNNMIGPVHTLALIVSWIAIILETLALFTSIWNLVIKYDERRFKRKKSTLKIRV